MRWTFRTDENGGRAFEYRATRDIAKGEEVTISYGPKNNYDILGVYGFYIPGNEIPLEPTLALPELKTKKGDKLRESKRKLYGDGSQKVSIDFGSSASG